jgi:hypothetical protein
MKIFQVTADPVSTCVQEIFALVSHKPLLVTNCKTFSFFISRIPVLNSRIFYFGIIMQLIPTDGSAIGFIATWRSATF